MAEIFSRKYCNSCRSNLVFPSSMEKPRRCPSCKMRFTQTRRNREEEEEEEEFHDSKPRSSSNRRPGRKKKSQTALNQRTTTQKRRNTTSSAKFSRSESTTNNNNSDSNCSSCSSPLNNHRTEIAVPDADVYDFDKDRRIEDISKGQIWALYDEYGGGMPRLYARIDSVSSNSSGFQARITWLDSVEKSAEAWVDAGFHPVCGDFVAGKSTIIKSGEVFSHQVCCSKSSRSHDPEIYRIVPKKSEVWAVYSGWSQSWSGKTKCRDRHGNTLSFESVEVVSDFADGVGVVVAPLTKAEGYRTLYKKQGSEFLYLIPCYENMRFSHYIPRKLVFDLKPQALRRKIGSAACP